MKKYLSTVGLGENDCFLWIKHTSHTTIHFAFCYSNCVWIFFFAMRIFLWCVYLGHCNFQKVLLNILLPYLSYLLPRCAVLCTKNKSGALWTHKRKMLSWVSLFIFLRWVYDLMPSFFIDSPLRGHNSL